MKKIVAPLLAFPLLLMIAFVAHAADCNFGEGCVDVEIAVLPSKVCPGDSITVVGYIKNCSECRDLFKVKIRLIKLEDMVEVKDFPGHNKCICPKIIIPLAGDAELKFSYDSTIPTRVPGGDYIVIIHAVGLYSGAEDEASAPFTVLPCLTP